MWDWRTTGNSNVAIQTGSTLSPTVWQISVQFRRQTCGQGRARRKCQQVTITSNNNQKWRCDITIKTGNSYTTRTAMDSVEIPTASRGFSTTASPNKVSPSDCENDRQPEVAMWPPKLEIFIALELWQIGWQFQRQMWSFPPRYHAHAKILTPGVCDNYRQPEMAI